MAEEKTEKPTPKKLEKAREEGQVAKSPDLVELACLGLIVVALQAGAGYFSAALRGVLQTALDFAGGAHSDESLQAAIARLEHAALALMLPVALGSVAAAVFAFAPQTGFQIATRPITPKFDAVNPGNGFKRIFSLKSVLDLVKMIVKALLIFAVVWATIDMLLPLIASSLYLPVQALAKVLWNALMQLLDVAIGLFLVIGVADYQLQRWMFMRQNRMSKDDVKREHKDSEGDPKIKSQRRKLAREFASTPPEKSISRANMLLVNPTHYAVAVRYEPGETPLPVILARGVDEQAAVLRRLAMQHGVPIVSNPPVARALYRVPEDQPVPEELLDVVAAILRWVDSVGAQPLRKDTLS